MNPFSYAKAYRERGWLGTLPLPYGEKWPPPKGYSGLKYEDVYPTEEQIDAWTGADRNIAVRLPKGIIGIDVDAYKDGGITLRGLETKLEPLPLTWKVTSRTDKLSGIYLYSVPETFPNVSDPGPSIEIIQHGKRYCTVAPSYSNKSKGLYTWYDHKWIKCSIPSVDDIPALPESWVKWWIETQHKQDTDSLFVPENAAIITGDQLTTWANQEKVRFAFKLSEVKSMRNRALYQCAADMGALGARGVLSSEDAFESCMQACGLNGYLEKDGKAEIVRTFGSGWSHGLGKPRTPWPPFLWPKRSWDDFGNAERLWDHAGRVVRYVADKRTWARYSNGLWILDDTAARVEAFKVIDKLPDTEALSYSNAGDEPERNKFIRYVGRLRYDNKLRSMVSTANGMAKFHISTEEFDTRYWELNTRNCVIDLRTGEPIEWSPEQFNTNVTGCEYNPNAKCPKFLAWFEEMMPDPEMREYVQKAVGYTLTGVVTERVMFIHHGVGSNGKSVFIKIISAMMGSYGQTLFKTTLIKKHNESHPTDIARMRGKRFLSASEIERGKWLDEELVKMLAGDDGVSARKMHQDFNDFQPTGKIHYATNHMPRVSNAQSIWDRLRPIEWPVRIEEDKRDKELATRIIDEELEGILAWAVQGCLQWQKEGLTVPGAALMDTQAYKESANDVADLITDCFELDPQARAPFKDVYETYTWWARDNNIRSMMTQKSLSQALTEAGFATYRSDKERGFVGFKLRNRVPGFTDIDPSILDM